MFKKISDLLGLTPSQMRTLEIFGLGVLVSLLTGVLDNFEAILNGNSVDWKNFLITFATTTGVAVIAGIKKYIRDQALPTNQ